MDVWESIFQAYSEGALFLSPVNTPKNSYELEEFVDKHITDSKDRERFDQLLCSYCMDIERHSLHAGLKIALRLLSE